MNQETKELVMTILTKASEVFDEKKLTEEKVLEITQLAAFITLDILIDDESAVGDAKLKELCDRMYAMGIKMREERRARLEVAEKLLDSIKK